MFNQVRVDAEGYTLVWRNGADFDPATLHDWPELETQLVEMARSWARARIAGVKAVVANLLRPVSRVR